MLKYRLLVVDDEKSQREILAGFLQKEGYAVTLSESGQQALKFFEEKFFLSHYRSCSKITFTFARSA